MKTTPPHSSHSSPLSRSLLNILLVLIESVLALVLRFDAKLRRAVYPLVKLETLVCIRTYLPHTQVYATFSYKGILLDDKAPLGHEPDVVINAYTHDIFGAILGQSDEQIDKLQMRGRNEDIRLIKAFLRQIGVGGVIQTIINKFKKDNKAATPPENKLHKLNKQLDEKTRQVQHLQSENKRLSTQLAEMQGKQKTLTIVTVVALIVAIIAIVLYILN